MKEMIAEDEIPSTFTLATLRKETKKAKKWRKKAEKGELRVDLQYILAHLVYRFPAPFGLVHKPIGNSEWYSTSELKDLISCLLDHQVSIPPRTFELNNKASCRVVVYINLSNVSKPRDALQEVLKTDSQAFVPVRGWQVSKNPQEVSVGPFKLLTLSGEECNESEIAGMVSPGATKLYQTEDSDHEDEKEKESKDTQNSSEEVKDTVKCLDDMAQLYAPYILSRSQMRLWNYPMLEATTFDDEELNSLVHHIVPVDELNAVNNEVELSDDQAKKRSRIDHSLGLCGTVPTLEEFMQVVAQPSYRGVEQAAFLKEFPVSNTLVRDAGFVSTVSVDSASYKSLWIGEAPTQKPLSIAAIDCEMCVSARGKELTRVTVVNEYGRAMLDCLVQPNVPIIDYRTAYSGITAELLAGVTTTLQQVQLALRRLIVSETILIGHSLDSDLIALKLLHSQCIDTAILYPHPCGFPRRQKLKTLAASNLKITIQSGNNGHCSKEDAQAALQLTRLKVEQGPCFGWEEAELYRVPLGYRLATRGVQCWMGEHKIRSSTPTEETASGFWFEQVVAHNNLKYSSEKLELVVTKACNFILQGIMTEPSDDCTFMAFQKSVPPPRLCHLSLSGENLDSAREQIARIRSVLKEISLGSVLLVSAQPSVLEAQKMSQTKNTCASNSMSTVMWSSAKEHELQTEIHRAHAGAVSLLHFPGC